jgi:hypothetical protein
MKSGSNVVNNYRRAPRLSDREEVGRTAYLSQRSPTGDSRENVGGPWRNLDIICNFYVYYTVSLYSLYSLYINITLIILL